MPRSLASQPSAMGSRKLASKSRRSCLQLKKRQEMTESRRRFWASLHMHLALFGWQPDEVMQLPTQELNWKVAWAAWAWPAKERTAMPTTASRMCLAKTIASVLSVRNAAGGVVCVDFRGHIKREPRGEA